MKQIIKNKEPNSLLQHRLSVHSDYDNYSNRDDLREALLTEQGYICCYCMQRIDQNKMKIEHWRSQTQYPELQLIYRNLLGACLGNEGQPKQLQHCDTRKGDSEIQINPITNCEILIKYGADGKIYSDDENIDSELNKILNLNNQTLKNNRFIAFEAVRQNLSQKYPSQTWTAAILKQEIKKYSQLSQKGQHEPYCQFILCFLRKKLNKIQTKDKSKN